MYATEGDIVATREKSKRAKPKSKRVKAKSKLFRSTVVGKIGRKR